MMYKVLVEHNVEADIASYFAARADTNPEAIAQIYNDHQSGITSMDSKTLREELTECAWEVA